MTSFFDQVYRYQSSVPPKTSSNYNVAQKFFFKHDILNKLFDKGLKKAKQIYSLKDKIPEKIIQVSI